MLSWLAISLSTYVGLCTLFNFEYNKASPIAYADETCHIVQAQYYCNGTYDKWNEVITTLPGLYFWSVMTLKPLYWITGTEDHCSIALLRMGSLFCGFVIYVLFHSIMTKRNPEISDAKRAFGAFTLSFFPMLIFYHFMYYTESLSLMLILLMHNTFLNGNTKMSAFFGALAVFTRQTNIIWVFWHAAMHAWNTCQGEIRQIIRNIVKEKSIIDNVVIQCENFIGGDTTLFQDVFNLATRLFRKCFNYIVIGAGFALFVILNNGIVVGDRANHQACMNIPQIFYFALYTGVGLLPILLPRLKSTVQNIQKYQAATIIFLGAALTIVHFKTVMHWYLLTDNTHFIHYIGSAIYSWYPELKYALTPLYVFMWFWIVSHLEMDNVLKSLLIICIAASVIPQLLMEFRYFVPGFILIRLYVKAWKWSDMIGELIWYSIVNYIVFNQYLYKPWDTAIGVRRMLY